MRPVVIREATAGDAKGIARVHTETWKSAYRGIVPNSYLDGLDAAASGIRWEKRLDTQPPNWFVLVAEVDNRVAAWATAGPERTADPAFTGEIGGLYVLEGLQRQGIGRALVTECVRRLQGLALPSLLIWVLKDNLPARAFYERLGGVAIREQPIAIGGVCLIEVAYGWRDASVLL
ncbi:MAG TPA: GNAT family N-acetyltransferase [Armatimonadota bacterium]|jgi:ribosomal protein S18 acetylase RimI-like enzyme